MQHSFNKPSIPACILVRLGFWRGQILFWSFYEPRNFGDWIGPYLYFKKTGKRPIYHRPLKGVETLFSAGSILHWIEVPDSAIIWGSGVMKREVEFKRPKSILAVRGPITRQRCLELSYDCPEIYGDPGILLPSVFKPDVSHQKKPLGVIPHYAEADLARQIVPDDPSVLVIDVGAPLEDVVTQIASCEVVISSSLHGLIISHAYGVPAGWVTFSSAEAPRVNGDGTKYQDYLRAFNPDDSLDCLRIESPSDFSAAAIENHIAKTPLPDHRPAIGPLWNACPF